MQDDGKRPPIRTIHQRFAVALLREALAGAGTVHVDYRVDTEKEKLRVFEPRRSANDTAPALAPEGAPLKQLGQGLLEAAGMVVKEVEVGGEPDWLACYFVPEKAGTPAPGLLGRMTRTHSILSALSSPAGVHEAHDEMRMALDLWALQGREAEKARKKRPEMAQTWVICTDTSKELQEGLRMGKRREWPSGFYFGPPMLPVHTVTLREVPETPASLILRLLGVGDVLEKALVEQASLPAGSPVRRAVQAALLAASPAEGEPLPIEEGVNDPVLKACRQTYRRWARAMREGG